MTEIKINAEPEHNTSSVFCWCAPRIDGDVVIHRSVAEITAAHVAELERDLAQAQAELQKARRLVRELHDAGTGALPTDLLYRYAEFLNKERSWPTNRQS